LEKSLTWVVYWWMKPFLFDEQTKWERFETREQAREFLRKVKKDKDFLKSDEIRQYTFTHLDTI
jgi:hypothetical protein